jgi:iron-sulfur cluster assembly protein/iron-sulfur cluster insertion protein
MEQLVSIKSSVPQPAVIVTDTAATKIKDLIDTEGDPNLFLRMGVRPGGCSGFSYEMFFDSEVDKETDIVEKYGDIRVVVDNQSAEMLRGSTLDYQEGLMGAGFAINNPNVTRSCGCGNSFS